MDPIFTIYLLSDLWRTALLPGATSLKVKLNSPTSGGFCEEQVVSQEPCLTPFVSVRPEQLKAGRGRIITHTLLSVETDHRNVPLGKHAPPVQLRNHTHSKSTPGKGSQHCHQCDSASCYIRADGGPLLCRRDPWANLWISRHPGSSRAPRGLCRRQEAPGRGTVGSRTGRWHPPPTSRQGPSLFSSAVLPEPAICQAPASFEGEAH